MIPEGDDELSADTRRARRHDRRRRSRRGLFLAGAIVGALAVGGSALALTGIVEIGRDSPSAGAGGGDGSPETTSPAVAGASTTARPCRSELNPLDPLRLWIGGDSLAGSLGPSLGRMTADTGIVQPVFFSKASSGLSTPEFWDWPEHGAEEMFKLNPEVAVFIVGANDTMFVGDDEAWRPQYEMAVEEMMTLLIGENRTVYWVGSPVLEDDDELRVAQLNRVFQEVAARHPEVVYVDAYALFATPEGEYTPSLTNGEGEAILVRADDGVHFTPEGGDHLANAIFAQLDPQCSLLAQAVPDAAKDVIETEGSSRVPGTSRDEDTTVTTRSSAPATVATTAPPVTAPPTTAAPTTAPQSTTTPAPPSTG